MNNVELIYHLSSYTSFGSSSIARPYLEDIVRHDRSERHVSLRQLAEMDYKAKPPTYFEWRDIGDWLWEKSVGEETFSQEAALTHRLVRCVVIFRMITYHNTHRHDSVR